MTGSLGFGRRKLIQNIVLRNWKVEKPEQKKFNYNELLFLIQEMLDEEGKQYLEPRTPLYGHRIFRDFAKHLLYRNIANYDSMVLFSSEKGTGKSSAAIMLAREWCRLLGIRFNPARHIAYNNADMMNKIDQLNKFEPLIADEAVRFASSEDWNRKENKELKKKIAQVRTKHLLFILCFPLKIYKLDKTYLESYVNYWCLTGDTKITTRDINGQVRYTPLINLDKRNPEILTYNRKLDKFEFKRYGKKIKTKKNAEIFEVELINGLKIKATDDHLFLTQRGYVKLKDLKDDDKIKIKTRKCNGCKQNFIPKKQSMIWCTKKCKSLTSNYKERMNKYQIEYRKKNKKEIKRKGQIRYKKNQKYNLKKAKEYREKNCEYIKKYMIERRKKNPEYVRKLDNEWRKKNYAHVIKKSRERWKRRIKNDISFKLRVKLGNQLKAKLKAQKVKKQNSALKYLGCSLEYFKKYIELKFKEGMSWSNHSIRGWHIDHIKPCAKFDLKKESEIKKCFHYTNMQPLWWRENLIKSDKYEE